jgi:drug/metabolite transporter (DMT)-like permease
MLLGNLCLAVNCFCAACFYISVKTVSQRFHPAAITAWSYTTACLLMLVTATATVPVSEWHVPAGTEGALLYWVVVSSIFAYCVIAWATSRLPASHVAAMQCLQPFAGTLLGWAVLRESVSWWDLGAVFILVGLICVVTDNSEPGQRTLLTLGDALRKDEEKLVDD